jgi:hypothetical protein
VVEAAEAKKAQHAEETWRELYRKVRKRVIFILVHIEAVVKLSRPPPNCGLIEIILAT